MDARFGVRARTIDTATRTVGLDTGQEVRADALLLATGSRNRPPEMPRASLAGVLGLRSVGDAEAIRAAALPGSHVVVVGLGFIGSEVAASLRLMGVEVTAVASGTTILERVLGGEVGGALEAAHREHGVRMIFDDPVVGFEGRDRVEAVNTRGGKRIACDFVVAGVGVRPNVEIAGGTGIEVDDGVVVDRYLRTSVPNVYAAGDVASYDHPLTGRGRVEHYDNAIKTGVLSARNMLGKAERLSEPHWFWSDQYDLTLQVAGNTGTWDRVVVRGSIEERRFTAFYLDGGVLVAAAAINRPHDARRSMKLIAARSRPDPASLADGGVDLRELASPEPGRGVASDPDGAGGRMPA